MKGKKIFDAITYVKDEYIEEARLNKLKKRGRARTKWLALAACMFLVAGIGIGQLWNGKLPIGGSSGGAGLGDENGVFMSYAGPVFPLKLKEADDEIQVNRHISYDFSSSHENFLTMRGLKVEDGYRLENTSMGNKKIKAIYPFVASFSDLFDLSPTIRLGGKELKTRLYAGGYSGDFFGARGLDDREGSHNILPLTSWKGYKSLLEGGTYEENAFEPHPVLKQDVIVYRFSDFQAPEDYDAATLAISFRINPEKTILFTYGFNGAEFREDGFRRFSYFVPKKNHKDREDKYLIVLGEDIGDYEIEGYKNGACEEGNELEGVSSRISREEGILSSILEEIIGSFFLTYGEGDFGEGGRKIIPRNLFLGVLSEFMEKYSLISPSVTDRYDAGMLEDIVSDTRNTKRVFYLEFDFELEAKESIEILAQMCKEPSFDFYGAKGSKKGLDGFDMVTSLGSNIDFKNLSAEVTNFDEIEIINQNYGFDLEEGITRVDLDLNIEHYYLEIKRKE